MADVEIKSDGGAVFMTLRVTGLVRWKCLYHAEDRTIKTTGTDSEWHSLKIDQPAALDLDVNKVVFRLINQTDGDQDYKVYTVWEQDGNKLHEWSQPGTLAAGDPAVTHKYEVMFLAG